MGSTVFVILGFEGPDRYSHVGGLGSRVRELSSALAHLGHTVHLVFVGDPLLPANEVLEDGRLHLHRWSQWISQYHPGGVYDGEDGKVQDWTASLAPWLETQVLGPALNSNANVVVMAEEWQTAGAVVALHRKLEKRGWTGAVQVFWNLNNAFGTDRIDWPALRNAAVITTVSRYMKQFMRRFEVTARVIPNGISEDWLEPPDGDAVASLRELLASRLVIVKIARWDPDKRWMMAIDAVAALKSRGLDPTLIARGGLGPHGHEVMQRARLHGLKIKSVTWAGESATDLLEAIRPASDADMIELLGYVNKPQLKVLYQGADVVLANSEVEPFGLVGLEVMASKGVVFIGATGEDYATPGYDCISLQTEDPDELVYHAAQLKASELKSHAIRRDGQWTALRYTWPAVIERSLMPVIDEMHEAALTIGTRSNNGIPASQDPTSGRTSIAPRKESRVRKSKVARSNGTSPAAESERVRAKHPG